MYTYIYNNIITFYPHRTTTALSCYPHCIGTALEPPTLGPHRTATAVKTARCEPLKHCSADLLVLATSGEIRPVCEIKVIANS